jgi:hypothetical protein
MQLLHGSLGIGHDDLSGDRLEVAMRDGSASPPSVRLSIAGVMASISFSWSIAAPPPVGSWRVARHLTCRGVAGGADPRSLCRAAVDHAGQDERAVAPPAPVATPAGRRPGLRSEAHWVPFSDWTVAGAVVMG